MIFELVAMIASMPIGAYVGWKLGRHIERKMKREDVKELVSELRAPYRDAAQPSTSAASAASTSDRLRALPKQLKCPRCGNGPTRVFYPDGKCGAEHPVEHHEHVTCHACNVVWFEQCPENYAGAQ